MSTTNEVNAGQTAKSLSERLKNAYEDVPTKLRKKAQSAFCIVHGIADTTFRAKCRGDKGYNVTESEISWMKKYSPYDNVS